MKWHKQMKHERNLHIREIKPNINNWVTNILRAFIPTPDVMCLTPRTLKITKGKHECEPGVWRDRHCEWKQFSWSRAQNHPQPPHTNHHHYFPCGSDFGIYGYKTKPCKQNPDTKKVYKYVYDKVYEYVDGEGDCLCERKRWGEEEGTYLEMKLAGNEIRRWVRTVVLRRMVWRRLLIWESVCVFICLLVSKITQLSLFSVYGWAVNDILSYS